jgi:hypothetical protein
VHGLAKIKLRRRRIGGGGKEDPVQAQAATGQAPKGQGQWPIMCWCDADGSYGPTHPISQARKCKLSSVLLLIVVN